MRYVIMIMLIGLLALTACNSSQVEQEKNQENSQAPPEENSEPGVKEELDEIVKVEITNRDVDTPSKPLLSEWCLAGSTYDLAAGDGSISSNIVGIETYKGKKYCKGEQVTNINGLELSTTYYFTYEGKEMWIISNVAGQTTEVYVTND